MPKLASKRVGALWRHEGKGGKAAFLTGTVDLGVGGEIAVAVFKNDRKKPGSKEPDFRMVLMRESNGAGQTESGGDDLP